MFNNLFKKNKPNFSESQNNKLFNDYLASHDIKKLQIGCGDDNLLDGWLNTDLDSKNEKVAFLDAGNKFPFSNKTFQYIYSEHLFEHLNFKQAENMLAESFRVLTHGGMFRMATPNIDFLINIYQYPELPLHKEYITWATKAFTRDVAKSHKEEVYSPVFVINNFFRDWGHQIIHNYDSIKQMLTKAGFEDIIKCEINKSQFPEFNGLERHGAGIPQAFNELETMVIEAHKK